ncbi:MAG TPA: hypothetical protein VLF43_04930, partial [Candidatus Saccharimonadales bacterium]|nr:hypothetical protein [Candidatus Saccharimonadales bacterium]
IYSEPKKYTVTADEQGEWEYEVKGLPAGSHRIEAATVDPANNKETERVKLLSFTVTASTKKVATTSVADKKEAGFPWIWVVVVVLLVGATVGFIWYMRRKKAKNTPPPATMGPPIGQQPTDDNSTVPPDNTQSQNL